MFSAMIVALALFSSEPLSIAPPHVITTDLWISRSNSGASTMSGLRYRVDLATNVHPVEESHSDDYNDLLARRKEQDLNAYQTLVARLRELGPGGGGKDITSVIEELQNRVRAGGDAGSSVVASPNGAYAVIALNLEDALLVNLSTLDAQRLRGHRRYSTTPIAWSPDSHVVAWAPDDTGTILTFDVQKQSSSVLSDGGGNICALAWSPDLQNIASIAEIDRRIRKTPLALLWAFSGHPDYLDDVTLEIRSVSSKNRKVVLLRPNQSEQTLLACWIEWH